MKEIPDGLKAFLSAHDAYIIAGHKEPDGDCIGSALALASLLRRQGKEVFLLSSGPFNRTETREFEAAFLSALPASLPKRTAAVIVDCSELARTGGIANALSRFPAVFIDHHVTNSCGGDANLIDASAPAAALLIQAVIEEIAGPPTLYEAEMLFFGVCTDTGFFRHLDSSSSWVFAAVSRLVACGANPKKTFAKIKSGKSFNSRLLIASILSRMRRYYGGRLIVSVQTLEETQKCGNEARDSDSLYQLIQSIEGVEAIAVVKQETAKTCTAGLRSLDKIDVSCVAASFGGGGHRQAAGLSVEGRAEDIAEQLVKAFEPQFR